MGYIAFLGPELALDDPKSRPVLSMIAAFIVASVLYLVACWRSIFSATEKNGSGLGLGLIVGFAILFRIILLFTDPILEIDLYRYIWDGEVAATIGDPYEYAPVEFLQWRYSEEYQIPFLRSEKEQQWLQEFAEQQSSGMQQVLQRIHFGQFTSPYPPVSQIFFAASQWICSDESSIATRVLSMKMMLVIFDLATGFVLILILRRIGMPERFSVAWFWCPLVLKEFANSGHLDSIAIFFCTLAVLFMVRQLQAVKFRDTLLMALCVALFLSLGIGAKVFPIVLVPIWAIATLRKIRFASVLPGLFLAISTVAINGPMIAQVQAFRELQTVSAEEKKLPQPGIMAFTDSWEINDMLFMIVLENLRSSPDQDAPWFAIMPKSWRLSSEFTKHETVPAFQLTRVITMALFSVILIVLATRWWRTEQDKSVVEFLNCQFLSLAWFWFLSPTQNPWYWCWAIPLLPFARSRTWFLVAVLTFLYYTKFHFENQQLPMNDFHFYVPFYQFLPVLILLIIEFAVTKSRTGSRNRTVTKTDR